MEVKCTVNLNGLEEKLQQLGPKLARKTLRKAVGTVGDMWIKEMKARVPVRSGDLRDSIGKKVSTRKNRNGGIAKVTVGPMFGITERQPGDGSQQPAVYGMFEEFGTKNSHATPWMRPTFDSTADKAVQLFADTLRDDLDDLLKG